MADTFYNQIAANRRNSLLLALFVMTLFGVLGFAIGYAISGSASGALVVTAVAVLFGGLAALGSYFGGDAIVLSVSGAKEVDETSAPQLLNVDPGQRDADDFIGVHFDLLGDKGAQR